MGQLAKIIKNHMILIGKRQAVAIPSPKMPFLDEMKGPKGEELYCISCTKYTDRLHSRVLYILRPFTFNVQTPLSSGGSRLSSSCVQTHQSRCWHGENNSLEEPCVNDDIVLYTIALLPSRRLEFSHFFMQ